MIENTHLQLDAETTYQESRRLKTPIKPLGKKTKEPPFPLGCIQGAVPGRGLGGPQEAPTKTHAPQGGRKARAESRTRHVHLDTAGRRASSGAGTRATPVQRRSRLPPGTAPAPKQTVYTANVHSQRVA